MSPDSVECAKIIVVAVLAAIVIHHLCRPRPRCAPSSSVTGACAPADGKVNVVKVGTHQHSDKIFATPPPTNILNEDQGMYELNDYEYHTQETAYSGAKMTGQETVLANHDNNLIGDKVPQESSHIIAPLD